MKKETTYTVELRDLTLGYDDKPLFEGVNISIQQGEFTALIGRNGTGKSTLLRTIAALAKPLKGEVFIEDEPISALSARRVASKIGFVSTEEVRITNLKVGDVVALGRMPYTNWIGRLSTEDRRAVTHSLELVGMGSFAHKSMDTLSDGERQRIMIARALAQDTPIILLDEPTAYLDLPNRYEICLLLRDLAHNQGKNILFSTHDLSVALELCDGVMLISEGRICYGTADELIARNQIQHIFDGTTLTFDPSTRNVRLR